MRCARVPCSHDFLRCSDRLQLTGSGVIWTMGLYTCTDIIPTHPSRRTRYIAFCGIVYIRYNVPCCMTNCILANQPHI